ncbi:DUF1501 domain-containing protein [Engelhardtia mirabilis]|uniref:Sulfatase n=1 Tax=Engelhardtia mirabilis TaxID=2528011 RepID=A0A518BQ74_9BACT|nr:hypothetical protein Pla133_42260 [Planctomycetes bacterium Pla133]QDV03437.1 hypothetical protein Pla86_42250 [Planctomycetes bacterium Pla86]
MQCPFHIGRRELLGRASMGFGALAFSALFGQRAFGRQGPDGPALHHAPRAKRVIFLYMDGGPSQVDTFDPKPRLTAEHGQPFGMAMEATQFDNNGNTLASPWEFRRYGESGLEVSDLFRNVGAHADKLCVVRSMTSPFSEHTNANYFLHTGLGLSGRPSMGAWVTYGLGSESENLPGYVVLDGGLTPPGGQQCFGSGFLPATFEGSVMRPGPEPVANVRPLERADEVQRRKLDLLARLDEGFNARTGRADAVESAIANCELAFRMQAAVPELADLSGESAATRALYGLDDEFEPTRTYASQCLLARRLVERGVRFVELTCPAIGGCDRWDQHSDLKQAHEKNARAVDRPIAGLLADLESRGLLADTLVVFAGEFGRTPFAQGTDGRDHNPFGFSIWLAGGGVRGGSVVGATDDFGYKAVERPLEIYDLHATMLHLLGVDHTRLTVNFGGREMRLTDVHGHVVPELLA